MSSSSLDSLSNNNMSMLPEKQQQQQHEYVGLLIYSMASIICGNENASRVWSRYEHKHVIVQTKKKEDKKLEHGALLGLSKKKIGALVAKFLSFQSEESCFLLKTTDFGLTSLYIILRKLNTFYQES